MIELTVKELVRCVDTMKDLSLKKLKGKVVFQLARAMTEIEKELQSFNKAREELINKYCLRDENGKLVKNADDNTYILQPEKIENFNKELNELLEEKIKLNLEPIDIDSIDDIEFTPRQIQNILFLIK